MKLLKKLYKHKTPVLFLLLGVNLLFGIISPIYAQLRTPAYQNFFSITSPETNAVLRNCEVSSCEGVLCNILGAGQDITSFNYPDAACSAVQEGYTGVGDPVAYLPPSFYEKLNESPSVINMLATANGTILSQRPLSTVDYVNDKVYALTHPGTVYASGEPNNYFPGFGYDLLRPIQGFWGWAVNVVYGFLIILIIVIAFAIMFQNRLGGSQVVTVQNAIPSIALAMILVPLSYAISGVFIDVITVGTNAVHDFLLGPGAPGRSVYENRNTFGPDCASLATDAERELCDRGLYADDERVSWLRARERIDLRETIGGVASSALPESVTNSSFFNAVNSILNTVFAGGDYADMAWFGSIINFAISILTIWIGIKIFFKLLGKYLTLILMPIISPFIFATAAIPGNGTKSIVSYLKTMGSAALFFIVTYAMFLLTFIFTDPVFQQSVPDIRSSGYVPPLLALQSILGDAGTSLSGAGSTPLTNLIFVVIGLGIYFGIPRMLENLDTTLGTKNAMPEFIKAPIDSFRESWRVTTRTAPALAARGASIARSGTRLANPLTLRNRFIDSRQARAGYTQYSPKSRKYGIRRDLDTRWAEAERARIEAVQSGRTGAAIAQANKLAAIESEAQSQGIALRKSLKSEERVSLSVKFSSNLDNMDNNLNFTTNTVQTLILPNNIADLQNVAEGFRVGKLSFSVSGEDFRFTPSTEIEVGKAVQPDPSYKEFTMGGVIYTLSSLARTRADLFGAVNGAPGTNNGIDPMLKIFVDNPSPLYTIVDDGKTLEVPLRLYVSNLEAPPAPSLLGTRVLGASGLPIAWRGDRLSPGYSNITTKLIFRVKGTGDPKSGSGAMQTADFKVFVNVKYDNR